MEKPSIEEVTIALTERFGSGIIGWETEYNFQVGTVEKSVWLELFKFLYDHETFRFRYLTTLCGIHYPDAAHPFVLMAQVHSLEHNLRIRFKTFSSEHHVEFDSLTSVFPAANWMEREAFDFYGFRFKGHPDLKRILNVDDMDYFPMRKEYPVEDRTRYDKDDTMFGRKRSEFDRKELMEKK
ncbi:MAG TPA: NADH-quinone oxidoreductase subunit C [Bacteroidia bacterium]|nr:NADH-quinone oxidoreductase subunit C [Bacteroidia bacterium]